MEEEIRQIINDIELALDIACKPENEANGDGLSALITCSCITKARLEKLLAKQKPE